MGFRPFRSAVGALVRVGDQSVALANARASATTLAQLRVDRLAVEQFLEEHRRREWSRPQPALEHGSRTGRAR